MEGWNQKGRMIIITERISQFIKELKERSIARRIPLSASVYVTDERLPLKDTINLERRPIQPGTEWGRNWRSGYFLLEADVPDDFPCSDTFLSADFGGEVQIYDDEGNLEETGVYLNYIVPEECSNIWFDGWVMPKGANVELAQKFIDFLSDPDNTVINMNYIGYTSAIAGDAVFEEMSSEDWYSEGEEGDLDENGNPLVPYDLNYFFNGTSDGAYKDGEYIIWVSEESLDRQIAAQYPSEEVIARSAIMQHFDNDTNAAVNEMWEEVKGRPIPVWAYIVIAVIAAGIIVMVLSYIYKGRHSEPKPKKGYRVLKKG